jgi:uncharacterized protein YdhG (YjbR/CyaY superfamily)
MTAEQRQTNKVSRRSTSKPSKGFTAEERAAMKERAREVKSAGRTGSGKADGESEVLAKIAEMPEADRELAGKVHAVVRATAPELEPRTWYGMPAYAKEGKVLCFFRNASKFKTRYATFGFSDKANLDEGAMWPTDFAVKEVNGEVEKRIGQLLKKALS